MTLPCRTFRGQHLFMKFLLRTLLLLLLSLHGLAQGEPVRPGLAPWAPVSTDGRLILTADGRYLLFTAGSHVHIYDLKKRTMLARIDSVDENVLEADPSRPYFYTWGGGGVQKRGLPLGWLLGTTPLPAGLHAGIGGSLLIEPEAAGEGFFTAVSSGSGNSVLQVGAGGALLQQVRGLPAREQVNAICYRSGRLWAVTSGGLWRQRDSVFEAVPLPGNADYGNARFHGDTLVILGRNEISWYDTRAGRLLRQTPIPGFFVKDANDGSGLLLRFHHPFALDSAGNVWVTNTGSNRRSTDLTYPPYQLALVGARIEYPFRSAQRSSLPSKSMGTALAYDAPHQLLAAAGDDGSIEIFQRDAGTLFRVAGKGLQLQSLRFTSKPGRLLLRTTAIGTAPVLVLNLANGGMETIYALEESSLVPGNRVYTEAQPTGHAERVYHSLSGQWRPLPYLRYRNETRLQYNDDEKRRLPLPHGQWATLSENGLLELTDSNGRSLRRLPLQALEHQRYGRVDSIRMTLNEAKPVPFAHHHLARAQFDSASNLLYLRVMDNYSVGEATEIVVDLSALKVVYQNTGVDMVLLPGGKQLLNEWGLFDLRTLKTIHLFSDRQLSPEQYCVSHDGKRVYALVWNGHRQPAIFDMAQRHWTLLSPFAADELQLDPLAERLYALSKEAGLAVWDAQTGAPLAQIVVSGNQQTPTLQQLDPSYLVLGADGYYLGQNKYYQLLQLQQEGRAIGLQEMDGVFHRPDKVLRALGYTPAATLGPLEKIAERRSGRFSGRFPDSDARIGNLDSLPFYEPGERVRLQVQLPTGGAYTGLMAYANGTALWPQPLSIAGKSALAIDVPLVDATTHLRVCLRDAQGAETPGDYVVLQAKEAGDRELYVIGMGAARYRDTANNLRYAAKDMTDLTSFLKTTSSYRQVHLATWQNEAVTPFLTDSIRNFLRSARPQDVVLCYFAGHGLLDKANQYFLATYPVDFHNPASGGIAVEALTEAIASAAARKKLILIDACNSGLTDDLLSLAPLAGSDSSAAVHVVSRGLKVPGGNAPAASTLAFTFQHFGQGTGVDILAAAAGNEYALERGDLKNGVFTYSLLQALRTGKADADEDGTITLSELQRYVTTNTKVLTRGAQQPTFRQANLYQDIPLFRAGDTYLDQLLNAAKQNDAPRIRKLLQEGSVNVNQQDALGFAALHYAAREGALAAVQALVEAGADVEQSNALGYAPLHIAARNNHYAVTYYLLTRGAGLARWNGRKKIELDDAMDSNTRRLILNFPQIRARQEALLALAFALGKKNWAAADTLREAVPDLNEALILQGGSLLLLSAAGDNTDAARWLLDHGAGVDVPSVPDGYTPLMVAAYRGNEALVRLLLEHGASKKATDRSGNDAASFARNAGNTGLLSLLQ